MAHRAVCQIRGTAYRRSPGETAADEECVMRFTFTGLFGTRSAA